MVDDKERFDGDKPILEIGQVWVVFQIFQE